MFTEKRRALRTRRMKQGKIVFNDLNSVLTCQLRNVSSSGVLLAFESVIGTPSEFIVTVPGSVEKRWARKVWQNNREIGAAFF
jgi:hypothetical protein